MQFNTSYYMSQPGMTTASLQPAATAISLPPISSIDFHAQTAPRSPQEISHPLPPPPRQLPPLPYSPYAIRPGPPQHQEYMNARPVYPGVPPLYHQMPSTRVPLPSTSDPNLIVAPSRHKAKEVKRRTKTGCLTCRKRRIKVRVNFHQPFRALSCEVGH